MMQDQKLKELKNKCRYNRTGLLPQAEAEEKQLEEKIADYFFSGQSGEKDATYVSNARHIDLLQKASQSLDEVKSGIDMGMPVDLIQIDFTRAWEILGEIIGENAPDVRECVCSDMDILGIKIDTVANAGIKGKLAKVSQSDSKVEVWVVPTNEELLIARDTLALISK